MSSAPRPPRLAVLLAWFALWRLPFWRALVDFFDSPEYVWRVRGGFWSGMHNGGGHLPFQGTEYGPAGALFRLFEGRLSEVSCMAVVSSAYGVVAYLALVMLWRRLFRPEVAAAAALLYPVLSGPGLADTSTYSMSALQAFLFGGSALLAEGLARTEVQRHQAIALSSLGTVSLGLAVYTHLMALLWLSVPAGVCLAFIGRGLRDCTLPPQLGTRVRVTLLVGVAGVIACGGALLLAGAEIARVHRANSTLEGVTTLLFRDWGGVSRGPTMQGVLHGFTLVTGGLGFFFLILGLVVWSVRQGAWATATAVLLVVSTLICGRQFVWGFIGRIYLPLLAFGVPLMLEAVRFESRSRMARWAEVGLVGVLFLQSAATTLGVLGTRRLSPHPDAALMPATQRLAADGDVLAIDADHRTYALLDATQLWSFDSERKLDELDGLRRQVEWNGHRLFTTSEALRQPLRPRDGHLVAATRFRFTDTAEMAMMPVVAGRLAVVLDAPLGREEYLAELMDPTTAPPLDVRLRRAEPLLDSGEALLIVAGDPDAKPLAGAVFGTTRDCVSRERYDAWELTAFGPALGGKCEALQLGITDASRVWMQPLPVRDHYRVELRAWAYAETLADAQAASVGLGVQGETMSRDEAERVLAAAPRPFAALVTPGPGDEVRLELRPIALRLLTP